MRKIPMVLTALTAGLVLQATDVQAQFSCRTGFTNNVQGAVITNISTQYYYLDGSSSLNSHRSSIGYHDVEFTYSRDDTSCVGRGSHVILVEYHGQSQAFSNECPDAGKDPQGHYLCWQRMPTQELNQRSRLVEGSEKKPRIQDLLVIYSIDPETGARTEQKGKWFDTLDEAIGYLKKQAEQRK